VDLSISESRNYWFIRTVGGRFYEEFVKKNFVAIDWDKVDDLELIKAAKEDDRAYDQLLNLIKKSYPKEKRYANVARQVTQFINEVKKGDVVLIPSRGTEFVTIGEVESENILPVDTNDFAEKDCQWLKRKKVLWRKTVERSSMDPYLFRLFYSQYTVTNAAYYATLIDRLLNSFFIKGDRAHLVLDVKAKQDISALDLSTLMSGSLCLLQEFNEIEKAGLDLESIKLKINVQSPGTIELYGAIGTIWALSVFLFLVGGKHNFKILGIVESQIEINSLLDKIHKFIEQRHKHKMENEQLGTALQNLQIKLPEELIEGDKAPKIETEQPKLLTDGNSDSEL